MAFTGFPKDFLVFFPELKAHNERPWFEDNKQRFRDSVAVKSRKMLVIARPPRNIAAGQ